MGVAYHAVCMGCKRTSRIEEKNIGKMLCTPCATNTKLCAHTPRELAKFCPNCGTHLHISFIQLVWVVIETLFRWLVIWPIIVILVIFFGVGA